LSACFVSVLFGSGLFVLCRLPLSSVSWSVIITTLYL
jgi:predicted RND superfamily exporter protein